MQGGQHSRYLDKARPCRGTEKILGFAEVMFTQCYDDMKCCKDVVFVVLHALVNIKGNESCW